MIETEQSVLIEAPNEDVWTYIQDIRRWANLFPGCRECTVIDESDSRWVIKVGAGGLVRTVNVRVHVDEWAGPSRVQFTFKLEGEPVDGRGTYTGKAVGAHQTEISLKVAVNGSGPMAPMWEAVSRPLLPQLAKTFAGQLKSEIELIAGVAPTPRKPSPIVVFAVWLRQLWLSLLGKSASPSTPKSGEPS